MNCNPARRPPPARKARGFTLAEVLAAMVFIAIVIPVAVEGLRVASLAGEVAQRKMAAARFGNKILNELKVTGALRNSGQRGVVRDHGIDYTWSLQSAPWTEDTLSQMTLATVKVNFLAQGRAYEVDLSTLVPQTTL
ncbi:MAG TPA: type II secretion system protein [Verrucomicrobiae bacterium]|jgi:prepilin-type N-terminal cleavage/methylation domain-containing protein|nr:type II secretion system protein [Verrucomicrobiae bacterium]